MQLGVLSSALESAVPEELFTSANSPGEAISAVKALTKAGEAGQRIYQITAANQATALPAIHLDAATMDEIGLALSAGKIVIAHTDSVSVPGWSGAGYIIMDPDIGEAQWKISGGAHGGYLSLAIFLFSVVTFFTPLGLSALFITAIALIGVATNTILLMDSMDCRADGPILIGAVVSLAFSLLPVLRPERGTWPALVAWLMKFIIKGEAGTSQAACRALSDI